MSKHLEDAKKLIGSRFARLVVDDVSSMSFGDNLYTQVALHCTCDCGKCCIVQKVRVTRGSIKSCGCLKKELYEEGGGAKKHGHTGKGWWSKEYQAWQHMKRRCYNNKSAGYKNYGGRGITVCDEWRERGGFEKFLAHIGPKPSPELSVDRIDVDGNYEPGNVRWATAKQQANNTRRSKHRAATKTSAGAESAD